MHYTDTLASLGVVTVLHFYCNHFSVLGMHKMQSACSVPMYQHKTTSKTSSSEGLTTVPVSTQHNDPCKKL